MIKILTILSLGSLALGQGEAIPADISAWFASTASLAAVIAALLALLRKHLFRGLDGIAVVAASLVLGVALGYLGKIAGYLGGDWLVFGLSAGVLASGGVDLVRGLRGGNASSGDSNDDAARARLR